MLTDDDIKELLDEGYKQFIPNADTIFIAISLRSLLKKYTNLDPNVIRYKVSDFIYSKKG